MNVSVRFLKKTSDISVLVILFLCTFFIRFPFFFRDYIDRDESTFILMGQSWVEGHLPYTELWDIKPPLTFLFFAGIIYVFGKSLLAIRFFGMILVIISSFFTYKIGVRITSKKVACSAAIASVVLQSLFGSLQGVMSEHITMAFFMPAVYLLVKHRKFHTVFLAGLLMGISVMIKLNIAYAILFLGIYLLSESIYRKEYTQGVLNSLAYASGIIIILLLTVLPYYLHDIQILWWKSVVRAPLEYAAARRYSILKMAPFILILFSFFLWIWRRRYLDFKNRTVQILVVAIIGIVLSFVKGGRINGHYLIQLHPILVIIVAIAITRINLTIKNKLKPYLLILPLLIPLESYLEYANVVKNKIERGTFFNGEGISVPEYIRDNNLETKNILFLGYHIGYWVLGENPPTKAATHPSNICKDEMFAAYDNPRKTAMEELRYIMEEIRPKTIVVRKNRSVFDIKEVTENEYIDAYLNQHYEVYATVEKAEILRRLD